MNKAITDGLVLMPPAFEAGLSVWSSGDGTAGSPSYQGASNAALVPSDQDFGGCLELLKTSATQKLRWTGQTPILPGCYLRIRARVKAMSGNLPSVRIAGHAMGAGDVHVAGLVETGPAVALTDYGQVIEVAAIVGTGTRGGVDMAWGTLPLYGHFGIDLTGATGGVVRIDDIVIEDITEAFLRTMMDWVDVRDFGARGDGITDDAAAFEAADAAAAGGEVLVPAGSYYLGSDVTMEAPVRFEGSVTMPDDKRLSLTRSFDLPTYADAFGDEALGFRKAFQALLNFSDHDSLDLCGRRIEISAPIDMQAAVANKDTFQIRRVIRNGQFNVIDSPDWTDTVVTSQATYAPANARTLTGVANIANIPIGSLVTGTGVGREVYVTSVNIGAGTLALSQPLYAAAGTQTFGFRRFKYVLDFSGFAQLDKFNLDDIEFQCNGFASAVMLAPSGETFHMRDCYVTHPKDRGITSIGTGCQDLVVDRCQFISDELSARAQDRTSIALNVNANDAKIRANRFMRFAHFAVMHGNGHLIVANHWFQGDTETDGIRQAGLVFTETNLKSTVTGNYIDNSFIEWTNEHDEAPDFSNEYSFGGLTVTGNICTVNDVAAWFSWLVVKPYGAGHYIHGLNVSGNVFKSLNGPVDRIERVDTTFAPLDFGSFRNITFDGNSFNAVSQVTQNPVSLQFDQATAAGVWTCDFAGYLPFGGWARNVVSFTAEGMVTGPADERRTDMPYVTVEQGSSKTAVKLNWAQSAKGRVLVTARVDNPW